MTEMFYFFADHATDHQWKEMHDIVDKYREGFQVYIDEGYRPDAEHDLLKREW